MWLVNLPKEGNVRSGMKIYILNVLMRLGTLRYVVHSEKIASFQISPALPYILLKIFKGSKLA